MGLHHEHAHGRVLRGLDARKHLEMTKRDSHGSDIKLHVPDGFVAKDAVDDSVATVYNVVYVTASADFTGSTAGYTTVTGDSQSATSITTPTATASTQTASSSNNNNNSNNKSAAASTSAASTAASTGSSSSQATTSAASSSASAVTSSSSSVVNNKSMFLNPPASTTAASTSVVAAAVAGTPLTATRNPDSQIGNTNNGMTGGAKAGLAFGILIGFALVAGLLFFCWRRRKNPNAHQELNEKRTSSIFGGKAPDADNRDSTHSTRTAATAPRLSLRPVTQFLPNLGENRKSAGNLLGIGGAAPMSEKPKSSWERRPVGTENPFNDNNEKQERAVNPFDEPEGAVVAAGTRSGTNSSASSTHSKSGSAGSDSMNPKSDVAAAAAAVSPQGANNVHRVQLDFKPSMEDELELKSGQLVRMLHEYDDGWALCVRMDRSQQGVAPRTCLSKVPVKPRPQGPPNGQRGPPPPGMRGPGPRQGPGMVPRPLSPSGRERSGSAVSERPQTSSSNGSNTSPTVARKPVPGQAL